MPYLLFGYGGQDEPHLGRPRDRYISSPTTPNQRARLESIGQAVALTLPGKPHNLCDPLSYEPLWDGFVEQSLGREAAAVRSNPWSFGLIPPDSADRNIPFAKQL